jgi:pyruvate-ferredoxin/flavodoxin oxidoreductase
MARRIVTIEGSEAAASVAHRVSEVIAIYPITPSSTMGELADAWSAAGRKNIWNTVPHVIEMQSEGGAAGALHGAQQAGALTTTFTASQGLLLMIPDMLKIAGELTPFVMHVSARALATHALSIFGDHSDVMTARTTGFAMLASGSIQEIHDLALVAHAATLESRVPFMHYFDGFRSTHEVMKIEELADDDLRAMVDDELVWQYRQRRLSPDQPVLRGTAQNPDVFFQGREAGNRFYQACPQIVQQAMDRFAKLTGRRYHLFDYVGAPDADRVLVMMGSGAEVADETVAALVEAGEKVGVLKVRLYRPFAVDLFAAALPRTAKTIAVLDRTKEPGSAGEPLYLDVVSALYEAGVERQQVIGGRYGLGSKEFNPAMVKGVFDEMKKPRPKRHFTIGIVDDVTHTSLEYDPDFSTEKPDVTRALFYGLGSDGTVGANRNSIKIIGEETDNYAQGYFVFDSRKSGSMTVSHLRFGPRPIRACYLIDKANFIACHQPVFLERFDVLEQAVPGATFLLNTQAPTDQVWDSLPRHIQEQIVRKKINLYAIDAYHVARETGMGGRINTVMQTCFFAISNVIPRDDAIARIKEAIRKTYGKRGEEVVKRNFEAVDRTLENLHQIPVPAQATSSIGLPPVVSEQAPEFVKDLIAKMMSKPGDLVGSHIPVSLVPVDGTYPTGTTKWEKRNIALEIPVWDPETCIQCNKCVMVCPHAVIRSKVYAQELLASAPSTFKHAEARGRDFAEGSCFTIQVAPEDCTGCALCVEVCPAKNKREARLKAINLEAQPPLRESERANWDFFLAELPLPDRRQLKINSVKGSQLLEPLFEFSGACEGCGETPYVKLVSQLFGDRMLVANATGCSSIYGGNLPTTPWTTNAEGRGPAWSNSLFEDNAEFGLGMRLTVDKHAEYARELVQQLASQVGEELAEAILQAVQKDEAGIYEQRQRVDLLKERLGRLDGRETRHLLSVADMLVRKSVWIMGGDGWAYDIGYGGLDHVLASGRNVNVLVLDTEVYSNTGGQMSKSTPLGAVAKFAAGGKPLAKKDLAHMVMTYGNVYVATVALGANDTQTVRAFLEAEAYDGPSLIIAYSHCIAHGINMRQGLDQQQAAVDSGHWTLFRFNPELHLQGKNPLTLDSKGPKIPFKDYAYNETRYNMLAKAKPEIAGQFLKEAQESVNRRWRMYEQLAALSYDGSNGEPAAEDQTA